MPGTLAGAVQRLAFINPAPEFLFWLSQLSVRALVPGGERWRASSKKDPCRFGERTPQPRRTAGAQPSAPRARTGRDARRDAPGTPPAGRRRSSWSAAAGPPGVTSAPLLPGAWQELTRGLRGGGNHPKSELHRPSLLTRSVSGALGPNASPTESAASPLLALRLLVCCFPVSQALIHASPKLGLFRC